MANIASTLAQELMMRIPTIETIGSSVGVQIRSVTAHHSAYSNTTEIEFVGVVHGLPHQHPNEIISQLATGIELALSHRPDPKLLELEQELAYWKRRAMELESIFNIKNEEILAPRRIRME